MIRYQRNRWKQERKPGGGNKFFTVHCLWFFQWVSRLNTLNRYIKSLDGAERLKRTAPGPRKKLLSVKQIAWLRLNTSSSKPPCLSIQPQSPQILLHLNTVHIQRRHPFTDACLLHTYVYPLQDSNQASLLSSTSRLVSVESSGCL